MHQSLRAKRRRQVRPTDSTLAGPAAAPSSDFPRGSSSAGTSSYERLLTSSQAQVHGQIQSRRADSVEESDAADDDDDSELLLLAGRRDLPDQLPSLPASRNISPAQSHQVESQSSPPRRESRAEKLREMYIFRNLAQRYCDEAVDPEDLASLPATRDNLRLAQAIHAYAIAYYQSRGLLPSEGGQVPTTSSSSSSSIRTRRSSLSHRRKASRPSLDRGRNVIAPHLWGTDLEEPTAATAETPDIVSDPADSDYIASEGEEDLQQEYVRHSAVQSKGGIARGSTVEKALVEPVPTIQGVFDETAMLAIATYIEESVIALLGDHGLSRCDP